MGFFILVLACNGGANPDPKNPVTDGDGFAEAIVGSNGNSPSSAKGGLTSVLSGGVLP